MALFVFSFWKENIQRFHIFGGYKQHTFVTYGWNKPIPMLFSGLSVVWSPVTLQSHPSQQDWNHSLEFEKTTAASHNGMKCKYYKSAPSRSREDRVRLMGKRHICLQLSPSHLCLFVSLCLFPKSLQPVYWLNTTFLATLHIFFLPNVPCITSLLTHLHSNITPSPKGFSIFFLCVVKKQK